MILELLQAPWHWAVAGVFIGLIVPTLLVLGNKPFGISSSLRDICAMCIPAKIPFFQYDWRKESWNPFFVAGIVIGSGLAATLLRNPHDVVVAESTRQALAGYGVNDFSGLMPTDIFGWQMLFTPTGLVFFVIGGFLVGFGTRYAGGCTSGHAIMGLSSLQWPSLVATIAFMAGGFLCANVILPFIFQHL